MAFKRQKWIFRDSIEYDYTYMGRYGAKGEKRGKRKKATPEQVSRQNQWNRIKKMRRLMKQNFLPGDLWVTLKYKRGTRKPLGEVLKDFKKFREFLRRFYRKLGEQLKYIYRIEIGSRGGIHIHILLNRIQSGAETDLVVQRAWEPFGRVNYEAVYEQGQFKDLAAYIVKMPDEETEKQLSLFPEKERKQLLKYSCSRNLERPVPEVKEYKNRTMRKVIENGPEPTKGFYIDPDSVVCGINPYTGMSYLQYIEYSLSKGRNGPERSGDG